jgi:hypothetical protein
VIRRNLVCAYRGDFRKNELTLFKEVLKKFPELELTGIDTVALISGTGKQIKFIFGFSKLTVIGKTGELTGNETNVLKSELHRIDGPGGWNPDMIVNYAEACGIHIINRKRFEEIHNLTKPSSRKASRKKQAA